MALTKVWEERVDTGGMFEDKLVLGTSDTPGLAKPWLAEAYDGWGRRYGRRWCADYEEAHRACWNMLNENLGYEGNQRQGPY
jgi:hypothetical protein